MTGRYRVSVFTGWSISASGRTASTAKPVTEARVWDTYYSPWAHVHAFRSTDYLADGRPGGARIGAAEATRRARALARSLNRKDATRDACNAA